MKKIKNILYIVGVDCLILFFALTLAVNLIELLQPVYKALLDMFLGIIVFFICKDITIILMKEIIEHEI